MISLFNIQFFTSLFKSLFKLIGQDICLDPFLYYGVYQNQSETIPNMTSLSTNEMKDAINEPIIECCISNDSQ